MGSEFIFENLGYPGTQHELSFCLQTPDCTKTDAERLQDNTERPFEVTALLSKSPFSAGSLKTKYDATDGNSYFTFLSPRMTVDTPWGAVSVYKNESDEASMISMKVQAHTARNALDSMQLAASAVLDYWSFESAVPAYIMHFRAHDITNEAEVFRVSAPFRVKPIGADDTEMPTPLRPVLALYREGLGPVDKRFNPKPRGGDIEEAHEGQGGFVVSGCNTPHLLEFVEHPLNAIAVSVTPPVCFLWNTAAFS